MARYFMHLRDGTEEVLDPDGVEYDTLEALREAVLVSVRDCISGDALRGVIDLRFRVDAEDAAGAVVYTLPFDRAVSIIPG